MEPTMSLEEQAEFNKRVPLDDVWLHRFYPAPHYTPSQCITLHQELMQPEMYNLPDSFIRVKAVLDLKTKKKTKFLSDINGTILLPHTFDYGQKPKLLVFCKTDSDREICEKYQIPYFGSVNVIVGIQKGEIHQEDYDHVICAADTFDDILPIRKLLKEKFPNTKTNRLGADIEPMIILYLHGQSFETAKALKDDETTSSLNFVFGKLSMDIDQLRKNFEAIMARLEADRPNKTLSWPFVKSATITCPPSHEEFKVLPEHLTLSNSNK